MAMMKNGRNAIEGEEIVVETWKAWWKNGEGSQKCDNWKCVYELIGAIA